MDAAQSDSQDGASPLSHSPAPLLARAGPGCSSLIGQWLELGPLIMGGDGTIRANDASWTVRRSLTYARAASRPLRACAPHLTHTWDVCST